MGRCCSTRSWACSWNDQIRQSRQVSRSSASCHVLCSLVAADQLEEAAKVRCYWFDRISGDVAPYWDGIVNGLDPRDLQALVCE